METTFYPSKVDGKIIAYADVEIARGITVRGFKVVNGKNGLFAAAPSRSFIVAGETRYASQVVFSDTKEKERFLSELLDKYRLWAERGAPEAGGRSDETERGEENQGPPF